MLKYLILIDECEPIFDEREHSSYIKNLIKSNVKTITRKKMNEIFYIGFFILLFTIMNYCLRIKLLNKIRDKRIHSYQKQWSQMEWSEYNLTRRL